MKPGRNNNNNNNHTSQQKKNRIDNRSRLGYTNLKAALAFMPITNVVVCCKGDALEVVAAQEQQGKNVAWVHIMNFYKGTVSKLVPLFPHSTKRRIILKFTDVQVAWNPLNPPDLFTKKQAQRLKRFLCNLHYNTPEDIVVVVNCNAGQSRSPAVGKWCESKFNVPVEFLEPPHTISPNTRVLAMLGK